MSPLEERIRRGTRSRGDDIRSARPSDSDLSLSETIGSAVFTFRVPGATLAFRHGETRHARLVAFMVCGMTVAIGHTLRARAEDRVDFQRDVQPILSEHCYECHGSEKQSNGYRLDRRRDALVGGTITVIAPGSAEASRLYLRLIGTRFGRQMPLEGR